MSRLLILSCSQRKRADTGLLPAIERYDGPPYRVLRRYLRQRPDAPPRTYILSAEFGLIPSDYPIPEYDRIMTRARAEELQPAVAETLRRIFDGCETAPLSPNSVLLCLGKDYRKALTGAPDELANLLPARFVEGGQGKKLTQLRDWLYGC